jgi:hypothetical protein
VIRIDLRAPAISIWKSTRAGLEPLDVGELATTSAVLVPRSVALGK